MIRRGLTSESFKELTSPAINGEMKWTEGPGFTSGPFYSLMVGKLGVETVWKREDNTRSSNGKVNDHEEDQRGQLVVDSPASVRGHPDHHRLEYVMSGMIWCRRLLCQSSLALLLVCAGIFLALRLVEFLGQLPWWAAGYGDDLICLPLVLGWVLIVQRLRGRSTGLVLGAGHGLAAFLLFSLYFEILLPQINTGFTADPWDVLMYAAGWGIFQLGINRPCRESSWSCGSVHRLQRVSSKAAW